VQELSPLIELAEVHVAEAQVVEKIRILGIQAEELLQVERLIPAIVHESFF
jgi:hypothetical protein